MAKHILSLSAEEKQDFLKSFDFVISDCDGVVWGFEGPIQGVKRGLEAIRSTGKGIAFCTNNGFTPRKTVEDKFSAMNIPFDYTKDLISPAQATVAYLKKINFQGLIYVMASDTFKEVLVDAGFQCFSMSTNTEIPSLRAIMKQVYEAPVASAVVFDVDLSFNLTRFYAAQHFLAANPDCLLLFGASDKTFLFNGDTYAGVGLFMEALASQAKQTPVILGKPSPHLGDILTKVYDIKDPSRVLFIGDTLKQDIGFANSLGFQSLLVLTGATTKEMLDTLTETPNRPTFFADSLSDFEEFLRVDA